MSFTNRVALSDHHLLRSSDLLDGNLHAQIATSNHDTVGCIDDRIEIVEALLAFDLGNDEGFAFLHSRERPDRMHIIGLTDERSSDHIHFLLDAELDILDVLLSNGRKIDNHARQVDVLVLAHGARILSLGFDPAIILYLQDDEGQQPITYKDAITRLHVLHKTG